MALKRICDICGKDAGHSLFIEDGGTQCDPASGRTEETGHNQDLCGGCLLQAYRLAVGNSFEAQKHFFRHVTKATGKVWKGNDA